MTTTRDGESAMQDTVQQSNAAINLLSTSGRERMSEAETESLVDRPVHGQSQHLASSSSWQTVVVSSSIVTVLVLVILIAVGGVWKLCRSVAQGVLFVCCQSKLHEASTHKSAKSHAGNVFKVVTLTFDLLTPN